MIEKKVSMMEEKIPVYWAVIGGLVLIAIFDVTTKLGNKPDVIQYIGFAGTITSLVLGVIAIFYSIISNTRSSENIGELKGATKEISDGAKIVSSVADRINNSLHSIEEISQNINKKFDDLPGHIDKVDSSVKELKELYETNIQKSVSKENDIELNKENISEEFVLNFIERSSFSGLQFLYAAVLAKKKGIKVDIIKLNEVTKVVEDWPYQYFHGYLVGCFCADIVITDNANEGIGVFKIVRINNIVEREIETAIRDRAEKVDSKAIYDTGWAKAIAAIEALYK